MCSNNLLKIIIPKLTDELSDALKGEKINTFLNPYSYLIARKSIQVFEEIDNIFIDGDLLILIFTALKIKRMTRVSFDFTSIADSVFKYCIDQNKSIYFVGSNEKEIAIFTTKIKAKYPEMNILGYRNGYFNEDEKKEFSLLINNIQPNIIVCGMGTPYQEKLLLLLKANGWRGTGFTCGGFFHQTASVDEINYYPDLVNKLNIRWLYRIFDEPKLLKRYLIYYPTSLLMLFKDRLS